VLFFEKKKILKKEKTHVETMAEIKRMAEDRSKAHVKRLT